MAYSYRKIAMVLFLLSSCALAKPVRVGLFYDPPLMYVDTDGNPTGISVEILKLIAEKHSWQLEFVEGTWNESLINLMEGRIDLLCSVVKTPSRQKKLDYCDENIYMEWGVIFTPENSDIVEKHDLNDKSVAMMKGDVHARNFERMAQALGIAYRPVYVDRYDQIIQLLEDKKVDAGVLNRFVGWKYQNRSDIRKTNIIFTPSPAYIATTKGSNPELITQIDAELRQLKSDKSSVYHKLFDKYFHETPEEESSPGWVIWLVGVVSGMSLVLLAFFTILRAEILRRMRQVIADESIIKAARQKELSIGAKIQKTILTSQPPEDVHGAEIVQMLMTAAEVGGDFTDYIRHADSIFDVVVADVMGKGVPGALLGAAMKNAIREASRSAKAPGEILDIEKIINTTHARIVNELISLEQFVTLLYLRIDTDKKRMQMIDCGHSLALWYQAVSGRCDKLMSQNMPIGFCDREKYVQTDYNLSSGDVLLLYTDGIIEARNSAGKFYGQRRLEQLFLENRHRPPQMILQALRNELLLFISDSVQKDDFSCIIIKIK